MVYVLVVYGLQSQLEMWRMSRGPIRDVETAHGGNYFRQETLGTERREMEQMRHAGMNSQQCVKSGARKTWSQVGGRETWMTAHIEMIVLADQIRQKHRRDRWKHSFETSRIVQSRVVTNYSLYRPRMKTDHS